MRELDRDALYVIDGRGEPVGLVLGRDLARAKRAGVADLNAVMRATFPRTARSAKLAEIFDLCRAGLPVAVVGERGRLEGVVNPLDVLAELAGSGGGGGEARAGNRPAAAPRAEAGHA